MARHLQAYVALLLASLAVVPTQSLYFYLSKGQHKCFKDELIKYSVSRKFIFTYSKELEAFASVLDKSALDYIN